VAALICTVMIVSFVSSLQVNSINIATSPTAQQYKPFYKTAARGSATWKCFSPTTPQLLSIRFCKNLSTCRALI